MPPARPPCPRLYSPRPLSGYPQPKTASPCRVASSSRFTRAIQRSEIFSSPPFALPLPPLGCLPPKRARFPHSRNLCRSKMRDTEIRAGQGRDRICHLISLRHAVSSFLDAGTGPLGQLPLRPRRGQSRRSHCPPVVLVWNGSSSHLPRHFL
jgi:hypothetical protein